MLLRSAKRPAKEPPAEPESAGIPDDVLLMIFGNLTTVLLYVMLCCDYFIAIAAREADAELAAPAEGRAYFRRLEPSQRFFGWGFSSKSDSAFTSDYRMTKDAFVELFELIEPRLPTRREASARYTQDEYLAALLYKLGHGTDFKVTQDVMDIGKTQLNSVQEVYLDAIISAMALVEKLVTF